jgi:hypothetical protein
MRFLNVFQGIISEGVHMTERHTSAGISAENLWPAARDVQV